MSQVAVIDYGMGNLRSVCKAIEHVAPDTEVLLTADPDVLRRAERLVFPGQGAISACVDALASSGMSQVLQELMHEKPFLGICLGLQALYEYSEEGNGVPGLGVLPGMVRLFPQESMRDAQGLALKVPHMGWNQVQQTTTHPLWRDIPQSSRFYFVHSYYADTSDDDYICGTTDYGLRFTSAAAHENIFAVQFHPEKSQHAGLQLLKNFIHWNGQT